MMKKYKEPLIVILIFVLQTLLHYFVASQYNLANEDFFKIYGFLFFITMLVILIVEFSASNFREQLGFIFIGIIAFKFIAAIIFMRMTNLTEEPTKYNFLIAYLILILLFTFYVARKLLNTDKKH